MLTQLQFASREDLVMPFEHDDPGASGRAAGIIQLSEQIRRKIVRDTDVVCVAEIVLQPFQSSHKFARDIRIEQATEKFHRITKLLGRDPQLVPLPRRQPAKPFTAPPYLSPAPIEEERRDLSDPGSERIGCL